MERSHVFLIAGGVLVLLLVICVRRVQQATAVVVERFGRYTRTLNAGLNIVVPFIDVVRNRVELREHVVPFAAQEILTQDNLVVTVDTALYYQVTDARAVTYEVIDYVEAIEQYTVTTLRNIFAGMDLEQILAHREDINATVRGVLDEATGKWGIRVNRVELKAIGLPAAVRKAMEREMRARSDVRVVFVRAEGERAAALLRARTERDVADIVTRRDGMDGGPRPR